MTAGRLAGVLLLALATAASGDPLPGGGNPPGWDPSRFMGVSELRPGMKGVGRTVFRDDTVEEFQAEILGVLETPTPGGEMILARLAGQGLETSGIIAGMSGSPVFVDGKLIGAVAFGWPFSSQPIAGITPVAGMLDLSRRSQAPPSGEPLASPGLPPETWNALWNARGEAALDVLLGPRASGGGDWLPLRLPVSLSGFSPSGREVADRLADRLGFDAVDGGAAGSDSTLRAPLEPGSAVAVELVRGDAQLAAVGTVTWREGDRIWAFGHPLLNMGATAYPMAPARIVAVMPRLSSSFKMGAVGPAAGAIVGDYTTGIVGKVGESPRMIPVNMKLGFGDRTQSLHFEILDAEAVTPALAGLVASSGVESFGRGVGASTLRLSVAMSLDDGTVIRGDAATAGFTPPAALAGEVARLVGVVAGNPFRRVGVTRIDVEAAIADSIDAAFIDRISTDAGPFRPGDTVPVRISLRDYRGKTWVETTGLPLPPDTPDGSYHLAVCDGTQAGRVEQERAPGRFVPRSFAQMKSLLEENAPGDRLVLRLYDATPSPLVSGYELPRLPASLRSAMKASRSAGDVEETRGSVIAERQVDLGRVLIGCETLDVTVAADR